MNKTIKPFKKGFTLTEVLVVVLIIGVMTAVAYPVYTKTITKSRAVEAINLLEMVRNKQIANFARNNHYFPNFANIGQLTGFKDGEVTRDGDAILNIGKYELAMNNTTNCMTAAYIPSSSKPATFTFSASYESAGLGCDGEVCKTFGNIIGDAKSVCNCGDKTCDAGLTLNNKTCNCDCLLKCLGGFVLDKESCRCVCPSGCVNGKICASPTQTKATSQVCGNGGTQTRTCTPSCAGGDCGIWGTCISVCDAARKPATSRPCPSGCGTQTRLVLCKSGSWFTMQWSGACTNDFTQQTCGHDGSGTQNRFCDNPCDVTTCEAWEACSIESCNSADYPESAQACEQCGVRKRSVSCDALTGKWVPGAWSKCLGSKDETEACDSGYTGNKTRTCSNNIWKEWNMDACTPEKECDEGVIRKQSCGGDDICNCATQSQTCNKDGQWPSDWTECDTNTDKCNYAVECTIGSPNCTNSCTCAAGYLPSSAPDEWGVCISSSTPKIKEYYCPTSIYYCSQNYEIMYNVYNMGFNGKFCVGSGSEPAATMYEELPSRPKFCYANDENEGMDFPARPFFYGNDLVYGCPMGWCVDGDSSVCKRGENGCGRYRVKALTGKTN